MRPAAADRLDGGVVAQVAQPTRAAPVPPQNLDAEESVLGAMMLSPGAIGAVSEIAATAEVCPQGQANARGRTGRQASACDAVGR